MNAHEVTLAPVAPDEIAAFKRDLQAAFAVAVVEELGETLEEPIPDDKDIEKSIAAPDARVMHVVADGRQVGGAVVAINPVTRHNRLDLFFIKVGQHGLAYGRRAWFAIEAMFPETVAWETATPYFEKRNIHFYVNVCGFHIVEFWNEKNRDPSMAEHGNMPGGDDMFRFVKQMAKARRS